LEHSVLTSFRIPYHLGRPLFCFILHSNSIMLSASSNQPLIAVTGVGADTEAIDHYGCTAWMGALVHRQLNCWWFRTVIPAKIMPRWRAKEVQYHQELYWQCTRMGTSGPWIRFQTVFLCAWASCTLLY